MTSATTQINHAEIDSIASTYSENPAVKIALLMCVLGGVFYCYEYYLRVLPSVIQPELMATFEITQAGLGTLIAYYYFAYVPLQIPVGIIMDSWGPRRVLTGACLLCAVGTLLFASTGDLWVAKGGRFLVGFGSAFAYVGVLKIANLWLPRKYFAMMAGFCTALGMFGAMSGGILTAKFINVGGWRSSLYTSAVVGLVLAGILWFVIRDKSEREFFQLAPPIGSERAMSKVWKELLEVIKNKQLWINGLIGCLMFLPLSVFAEFWAVSYLEQTGLNKESAALGASMVFLGFALGGPIWGRVSDMIRSRRLPLMFGALTSALMAVVFLYAPPHGLYSLYTILFLHGFLASAQVLVFAVGEDICRPGMTATTVSFTNFLVMLGGMRLQPLVGDLLDRLQTVNVTGEYVNSTHNFKYALLVLPLGLILASVLSFFLRESYNYKS